MWDELMEVNGGVIAPDKWWWYLIDFKWQNNTWKAVDAGSSFQLKVRDKDTVLCNLPLLKGGTT